MSDAAAFRVPGRRREYLSACRVLVLDADMVPALSVARSLARRQLLVDVASAKRKPIAAYSNAVHKSFEYPDPLLEESDFIEWVVRHSETLGYDLIIPVTERSLVPLSRHRSQLGACKVAMASEASLELALDKSATFDLARKVGVEVPTSHLVTTLDDLVALQDTLAWPAVVKPVRSVALTGTNYTKHTVSYAFNDAGLRRELQNLLPVTPVVLQSYFVGVGVGVEVIARQGELIYAFQHERIHEVPLTGGGSSYRKSTELAPALLEATKRLIKGLSWDGVAMVEFKWNPSSGEYRLMEVNGRFWGSLPLAVAAGADFPAMLVELELRGRVSSLEPYRRDVYCRKLSRDLAWLEQVLRGKTDPVTSLPKKATVIRDLAQVFLPKHYFDVQSLRDPVPGLIDTYRMLELYANRALGLLSERWFTAMQRVRWRNGEVREKLRASKTVLFLCYGNINRSALSHLLFERAVEADRVEILSAGFHPHSGREMDPTMQSVAQSRGVSIGEFTSMTVDDDMLELADIVFVMEKSHYDRVREIQPRAQAKVFLLGSSLSPDVCPAAEIADPYGRSEDSYIRCFNSVESAIDKLAAALVS